MSIDDNEVPPLWWGWALRPCPSRSWVCCPGTRLLCLGLQYCSSSMSHSADHAKNAELSFQQNIHAPKSVHFSVVSHYQTTSHLRQILYKWESAESENNVKNPTNFGGKEQPCSSIYTTAQAGCFSLPTLSSRTVQVSSNRSVTLFSGPSNESHIV